MYPAHRLERSESPNELDFPTVHYYFRIALGDVLPEYSSCAVLPFVPSVPGSLPRAFGARSHFIILTLVLLITLLNSAPTVDAADSASESLFSATKVGNDSGPEGTYYELGTIFRATVPGRITQLRVYALASETGNHVARLWRNLDGALI